MVVVVLALDLDLTGSCVRFVSGIMNGNMVSCPE
jgi:hypothetical protein